MAHSFAQETGLTCPECGQSFTAQVWQIVDTAERPDLAARIHEGTLHDLPCPHCGHQGAVDAPLLLYRPDRDPPLLFSPAQGTTAEQDREQAAGLVGALRGRLGPAWQDEWVAEGLTGMPREFLPMALSEGPEAALRQMAERAQQEMERLREEDPERYRQLEEAARQAMEEAAPLLQAVQEFVEARTWAESRRVVEGHPELLTSEADGLLGRLVGTARAQGDENGVHVFEEHRALLRRCREVGIERAFAEETGGSDGTLRQRRQP
jgi:hypothetical protein